MLGWVAATGDFGIEAGTLFLIQFFGPHFGQLVGSCMKIMKGRFFVLPTGKKRQRYRFAGYFVYRMAYYSVITAFLRLQVGYLYLLAAVVIFYWVFGCCFMQ
jgi:heme O synthase-like polyprenyltransferase